MRCHVPPVVVVTCVMHATMLAINGSTPESAVIKLFKISSLLQHIEHCREVLASKFTASMCMPVHDGY